MGEFRLLAHTADMGIEATGASLGEVFIAAAHGLKEMIFGATPVTARQRVAIALQGGDPGELLVGWLGEILYLFEVRGLVPAEFAVTEITGESLRGEVAGEPFDALRHPVEREVKAITYHQLSVQRENQGWRARLYVDL